MLHCLLTAKVSSEKFAGKVGVAMRFFLRKKPCLQTFSDKGLDANKSQ